MTRWSVKVQQWKHRVLCRVSGLYRDASAVRTDRDKWRRECIEEGNRLSTTQQTLRTTEKHLEESKSRLRLATDTQDSLGRQLTAERALRESAESRAAQYHDELVLALKHESDWFAVGVVGGQRRPIHGTVTYQPPPEPEKEKEAIRPKPMARQAAADITNKTLQALLADIRNGQDQDQEIPIGPEFTTN